MNLSSKSLDRQNGCLSLNFIMPSIDEIKRENLQRIIKKYNLTQRRLAEIIEQDPRYLNRIFRGHRNLADDMVERICKALNIKRYEFYIEDEDELPATPLQLKLLNIAKEAEKLHLEKVAEEMAEYTSHRLDVIKKQEKSDMEESKPARAKVSNRRSA